MSWIKKTVAISSLVLVAGCSDVLFDKDLDGDQVKLEESNWIIRKYDLTVMKEGYTYSIRDWGANGSADTMTVDCPDKSANCSVGYHGSKQELYGRYMGKLNELGVCHFSCPVRKPK